MSAIRCTPDEEYDPTFQGFSIQDVSVESKSYVCLSRLCLVNHFQGRVTCPYGQTAPNMGPTGPAGAAVNSQYGCGIPGTVPNTNASNGALGYASSAQVTASNVTVAGCSAGQVPAQAVGTGGSSASNRTANQAVYCSCRCENVQGNTNDGDVYCTCPENYTCTQLVTSIGAGDTGLTGGYCILNGTAYNPALSTATTCPPGGAGQCDPTVTDSSLTGYCPAQY